jgi:hypothetical protein
VPFTHRESEFFLTRPKDIASRSEYGSSTDARSILVAS